MSRAGRRATAALALSLLVAGPAGPAGPARAETARDLGGRMVVDGFPTEYLPGEQVFGVNAQGVPEESNFDSAWGPDNDFNQIRITWDRKFLYVAAEGVIYGNNMVVYFDVLPDRGLAEARNLNSWSRNFIFSDDFRPDIFLATWDGNANPRLLIHQGGAVVRDEIVGPLFSASATFSTNLRGRSMEYAIPWNTFFLGSEGEGVDSVFVPSLGDTVYRFTPGATIKVAGVITAGGDNTGGPDSAPDNTRGHVVDGSQDVVVDNYAVIRLDERDDTGLGGGGPDGVADWGVEPRQRVSFKFQPPVTAVRITASALEVDRPAFAPGRGEVTRLSFRVDPPLDPDDPINQGRTVNLTANVFNADGRFVRNLFVNQPRLAVDPQNPLVDFWDGRDEAGRLVTPGVYVLRLVVEPNSARVTRAVVVLR